MSKVWLVTGANSGFGRAITEAAVAAGDVVVATARRPEALDDLVAAHPDQVEALTLDVTDAGADRRPSWPTWSRGTAGSTCWSTTRAAPTSAPLEETTDAELRDLFERARLRPGGAGAGGAAAHAGAAFRGDRADEQHGRADVVRRVLRVQRDEVRSGGLLRGAGRRGRAARHQGADRGAGRVPHEPVRQRAAPARRSPTTRTRSARPAGWSPAATVPSPATRRRPRR